MKGKMIKRKKKYAFVFVYVLFSAMVCISCGRSKGDSHRKVADNLAEIMLPMDYASKLYGEGLDAIGDYLDGMSDIDTARQLYHEKLAELERVYEEMRMYEIPEEIKSLLDDCDINEVEYQSCADERLGNVAQYIQNIGFFEGFYSIFEDYGGEIEDVREDWERVYDIFVTSYEAENGYYYYYINYFCATWDEDATAYVDTVLLDQLEAYDSPYLIWKTDREEIERTVMGYLDIMEECVEQEAVEVEKLQLYQESYRKSSEEMPSK